MLSFATTTRILNFFFFFFCFLILIRAIVFLAPLGSQNLNKKGKTKGIIAFVVK